MPEGTAADRESPILVRKYGGSSLADVARLKEVARDIRRCRDAGYRLVVVVSAMGRTTDELAHLASEANTTPPHRELDMLLSVGERITMSLLCMALAAEDCPALSLTGSQCGIITDTSHTDARILEVRADRVLSALAGGHVVVVAGFQGVSLDREITTLGRGGSDTSAVALAAALGAVRCEILKDVPGVHTADPRMVPGARVHATLSYAQMQRIAESGCGVVHPRAVAYARNHGVPLLVGSSFADAPGTRVGPEAAPAPAVPGFQPLVLNVVEPCARLAVTWSGEAGARAVGAALAGVREALAGQWLADGETARWEGWGPAAVLAPAAARLRGEEGLDVAYADGLACLSLAGEPPGAWPAVLDGVRRILAAHGLALAPVRSDGASLRILAPRSSLPSLPRALHDGLLPG